MAPTVTRLSGIAAARARYGDKADRVAMFFHESDKLADAAIESMADLAKGAGKALVDRALTDGIASVTEAPEPLMVLFRQLEHIPIWVDRERCIRGGDVVSRAGAFGGLALFGCLARSYCSQGGNKPLVFTRALIDDTGARLTRTADFVRAVSQPDALTVGGGGYQSVVKVRLAHAYVRRACARSPEWRTADWGLAINQADMAGTTLLFSRVLVKLARRLGCAITEQEEGDLLHLWRYAGYLIGVDQELLCTSVAESEALEELIDCMDAGPDADSRLLMDALLSPKPYIAKFGPGRRADAARAVHQALCRLLIGDVNADAVALPRSPVSALIRATRPGLHALSAVSKSLPFGSVVQVSLGRAYWQRLATGT